VPHVAQASFGEATDEEAKKSKNSEKIDIERSGIIAAFFGRMGKSFVRSHFITKSRQLQFGLKYWAMEIKVSYHNVPY